MAQDASWDIVTGVGFTALGVAAARAIETHRPDRLVDDPYAELFVRAAHPVAAIPTRMEDVSEEDPLDWREQASGMGVRSKFFDTFLADTSTQRGIDQVVLLAAGLDTRAFRLNWPKGSTVYELDAVKVLQFKDQILTKCGARPRCLRRTVPVDLRQDWVTPLRHAGFDPARPTTWLVEGLLTYLTDEASNALFNAIGQLSKSGSAIAVGPFYEDHTALLRDPYGRNFAARIATQFGVDMTTLWPAEQSYDPVLWLTEHGWSVSSRRAIVLAQEYGRIVKDTVPIWDAQFISAHAKPRSAGRST